jgi:tetratricopeptide (TPR) repeat protein
MKRFILHPSDLLDTLTSLANKSLVQRWDVNGEPRFAMLETIRQFAHEKSSESGELTQVRDRHLDFYAQFAEDAEPKLRGADQMLWLNRMEAERDNLRAALTWSLEGGEREAGLRIGAATFLFWLMRGHDIEGERWLNALVERYGAGEPTAALGKVFVALGINAFDLGNLDAASAALDASLRILRKEDKWWYAHARLQIGWLRRYHRDLTGARAIFEEMVAFAREVEDKWTLGDALGALGTVYSRTDLPSARIVLEESVRIFREIGDGYQLARALIYSGGAAHLQKDWSRAMSLFEESVALLRERGDKTYLAMTLKNMGLTMYAQGEVERANALFAESIVLFQEAGDKLGVAGVFVGLERRSSSRKPADFDWFQRIFASFHACGWIT